MEHILRAKRNSKNNLIKRHCFIFLISIVNILDDKITYAYVETVYSF